MKSLKILCLTVPLLLLLDSCAKDLVQNQYGTVNDTNFWTSYADLEESLDESRSQLDATWAYYTMFFMLMQDGASDYWVGGANDAGEFTNFGQWRTNYPDPFAWGLWPQIWNSIYYANLTLDHLASVPGLTTAQQNEIIGEAKFERALNYYFAQDAFGGVVIELSSDDPRTTIPQSPRDSVRTQVESDLLAAAAYLPDKNEISSSAYSLPSKQAAWGLLARLYLNWEDRSDHWQKASDYSDSVINSNMFQLVTPYSNLFSLTNKNNSEMVYSIHHDASTPNGVDVFLFNDYIQRPVDMKIPNSSQVAWGDWSVTTAFYNSFEPGDQRQNQLLMSYVNTSGDTAYIPNANYSSTTPVVVKYPLDPNTPGAYGSNDQPIIRYADILLMKAEAQNAMSNTATAIPYVNQIRERAGLADLVASNFNQTSLSQEIYNERRWEFFYEGLARTDMIRFGTFLPWISQKIGSTADSHYLLYPFPLSALTGNTSLAQNPGYPN